MDFHKNNNNQADSSVNSSIHMPKSKKTISLKSSMINGSMPEIEASSTDFSKYLKNVLVSQNKQMGDIVVLNFNQNIGSNIIN